MVVATLLFREPVLQKPHPYDGPVIENDRGHLIEAFSQLERDGYAAMINFTWEQSEGWARLQREFGNPERVVFYHYQSAETAFNANGNLGGPLYLHWSGDKAHIEEVLGRHGLHIDPSEPENAVVVGASEPPGVTFHDAVLAHGRTWGDKNLKPGLGSLDKQAISRAKDFERWLADEEPEFHALIEQDIASRWHSDDLNYRHYMSWYADGVWQRQRTAFIIHHSRPNRDADWSAISNLPVRTTILERRVESVTEYGHFATLDNGLLAYVDPMYGIPYPKTEAPLPGVGGEISVVLMRLDEADGVVSVGCNPRLLERARRQSGP